MVISFKYFEIICNKNRLKHKNWKKTIRKKDYFDFKNLNSAHDAQTIWKKKKAGNNQGEI